MAVRAGGELGDGSEPGIGRLQIRERSKAARAHRLIAVHLGQIRLVHGARADILRVNAAVLPN